MKYCSYAREALARGLTDGGGNADRPLGQSDDTAQAPPAMIFDPPLADIVDTMENVVGFDDLLARAAFPELDAATMRHILDGGAMFSRTAVAAKAAELDAEGCRFEAGRVRLPHAFAEIWRGYVEQGWLGLSVPRTHGGHGLPQLVQAAFSEMVCGSCVAASMLPLLVRGATDIIGRHADGEVKDRYLPELVGGRWAATICITEAGAGSDAGAIRTTARIGPEGEWLLRGTKIFISFGDHQLTDGILHLVLAQANTTGGIAGLRLFAVPAFNDRRRDSSVVPLRIEHKLGLNASPTCVMQFDDALGFPLSATGDGLRSIFAMINQMRLEVAVQGVGLSVAAT